MKKWQLGLVGVVVVAVLAALWFGVIGPRQQAAAVITKYHVNSVQAAGQGRTITFAKSLATPKIGSTAAKRYSFDVSLPNKGNAKIILQDSANDDGWNPVLTWTPRKHELVVSVSYVNGDPEAVDSTGDTLVAHYHVGPRGGLRATRAPKLTGWQRRTMAGYYASAQYLTRHLLRPAVANQVCAQLKASANSRAADLSHKADLSSMAADKAETAAISSFLKKTFRPQFSQAQWVAFVQQRVQTLGLQGATVTVHPIDMDAPEPFAFGVDYQVRNGDIGGDYDHELTSVHDAGLVGYAGCLSDANTPGIKNVSYLLVTAASGTKYLAVIPLALYKQPAKTENFFHLMAMSSLLQSNHGDWATEFVTAKMKPSAKLVSDNIVLAQELEE